MERVGLVADTAFPNLALMRLTAYHRRRGDEILFPYRHQPADRVYASIVFSRNREDAEWWIGRGATVGGTGWDLHAALPPEVEVCSPDYSLYPKVDYSIGFSSRGCVRRCAFCVVPEKEGGIRSVASIAELLRPDRGDDHMLVLLDNNFLANPDRDARMDEIERLGLTVNFNQGLDIRLVDRHIAERLARLKVSNIRRTRPTIHFAFDHPSLEGVVRHGVAELALAGVAPWKLMFYILCAYDTTFEEDMYRFEVLCGLGVDPYVMVYDEKKDLRLHHFERWVNARVYKVCAWTDYAPMIRDAVPVGPGLFGGGVA